MPGLGRLATSSASGSDALMPPYWAIQRPGPLGNLQMAADGIKLAAAGQQLVALRFVLARRRSGSPDDDQLFGWEWTTFPNGP
jgi:hypothetical protein